MTGPGGGHIVPGVRCDACAQVWLAPGLRPGEDYACKGCGRLVPVSVRETPRAAARGVVPCGESRTGRGEEKP